MTNLAARRVSPFGHPGITAHVQLPQAYRSLSRPSSPLDAKASTVCLIAFDLKSHVVSRPAIGPARPVLIPHTLPVHVHDLASETASTAGKPSIRRLSKSRANPVAQGASPDPPR